MGRQTLGVKIATVIVMFAVTGCESDEERLERLRLAEALARLSVLKAEQDQQAFQDSTGSIYLTHCGVGQDVAFHADEPYEPPPECVRQSELSAALSAARDRYDLARRDLNRFLR